jgi:hypothetical protein
MSASNTDTTATENNRRDEEEAPLLGSEQPETCQQRWKRFKREHRVHFGIGWVNAMLITAFITYLVNLNASFDPDVCVSDRSRPAAIVLSVFFGSLGKQFNKYLYLLRTNNFTFSRC